MRDRGGAPGEGKIGFSSAIPPRYPRRTKSIEELLPWLYLKGISTGDFSEALAALPGPEAPGLSASAVARLKEFWRGELERWERRNLEAKRSLYIWADGVYFQPRLEDDKQCILVIIGADAQGKKELLRSPTASARAASRGASYSWTSSAAAWRSLPSWPSATLRWASGKPCARSTARSASSAVGCTKRLISASIDQNPFAHFRVAMEMIFQG